MTKSLARPHMKVTYLFCGCVSLNMLESLEPGLLCSADDSIMYLLCVPTTHYHWTLILDRAYVSETIFWSLMVRCVSASVMDRQKSRIFENRSSFGGKSSAGFRQSLMRFYQNLGQEEGSWTPHTFILSAAWSHLRRPLSIHMLRSGRQVKAPGVPYIGYSLPQQRTHHGTRL